MEYRHDDIIYRFAGIFNMPFNEAEKIFHETKKWIWLAALAKEEHSIKLLVDNSILFIDEMWHNFILFTTEYHNYCLDKFGFYVHHHPTPYKEKKQLEAKIKADPTAQEFFEIRKHQYSYIYDKLGAETLELWYDVMGDKYTPEYLLSIRKK